MTDADAWSLLPGDRVFASNILTGKKSIEVVKKVLDVGITIEVAKNICEQINHFIDPVKYACDPPMVLVERENIAFTWMEIDHAKVSVEFTCLMCGKFVRFMFKEKFLKENELYQNKICHKCYNLAEVE